MAPEPRPILQIPGFFYDEEKQRYFKIDKKAPTTSAYSAASVKRRKQENEEQKKVRRRLELESRCVRQSRVLSDAVSGGFLAREAGISRGGETALSSWALGLMEKGIISMWPGLSEDSEMKNLPHFYVDGQDTRTGLGVAYGSYNGTRITGIYVPRDDLGNIDYKKAVRRWPRVDFRPKLEGLRSPRLAALKYHKPSDRLILVSGEEDSAVTLRVCPPPMMDPRDDDMPNWVVGDSGFHIRLKLNSSSKTDCEVNTFTPSQSQSLGGLVGTSRGLACFRTEGQLYWQTTPATIKSPNSRDVLGIDFLRYQGAGASSELAFAGCRSGHIWAVDLRASPDEWLRLRSPSPVCHLRSLDEHHVLAAGSSNTMCVYDLRWLKKDLQISRPGPPKKTDGRANPRRSSTKPVLTFPGFRNNAQLQFGLDVHKEYNLAAAAHDDGTVALYSTKTGARLRAPGVDDVRGNGTVRNLLFQTMPNDSYPSLFTGIGPDIKMFSWGLPPAQDDEWTMP